MKKIFINTIAVSALLLSYSCDTDFDKDVTETQYTSGEADFSKYVSLGNSLTSGYRDNALYVDGQNESYPSMIAAQMQLAGGGEFKQPMMADNLGGMPSIGVANKLVLAVNNGALGPVVASGTGTTTLASIFSSGPYQNMGVPGAKSFHLGADGYGNVAGVAAGKANPYFVRFASSASTSVLKDALAQKPTFFSLWIGNNDVLSYATSGGSGKDQTGNLDPTTYGSNDITDPNVYKGVINSYLQALTAGGAKGVIANIPSVTAIPYFTTVPYNAVPLDNATATSLNQSLLGPLKQVLTAFGQGSRINLAAAGQNPILIMDKDLDPMKAQITAGLTAAGLPAAQAAALGTYFSQARHATKDDLVVLTASSVIGKNPTSNPAPFDKLGVTFPLDDKYVLTSTETARVTKATTAYNAAITALAAQYNIAFVDANAKMVELKQGSGIMFDGVKYTATFVTGGTFSLDGVHLTGRGYGVIANEFIKAINMKYKSNLPQVNPNSYSGVTFP